MAKKLIRLCLAAGVLLCSTAAGAADGPGVYAFSTSTARSARAPAVEPPPGMPLALGRGSVQRQRHGVVLALKPLAGDEVADPADALVELTLRMEDCSRLTVAQPQGASFVQPGDRVEVVSSGLTLRVVLAGPRK